MSLFTGWVCEVMWMDSKVSLQWRWECCFSTLMFSQSMGWWWPHACSAKAEFTQFPTACWWSSAIVPACLRLATKGSFKQYILPYAFSWGLMFVVFVDYPQSVSMDKHGTMAGQFMMSCIENGLDSFYSTGKLHSFTSLVLLLPCALLIRAGCGVCIPSFSVPKTWQHVRSGESCSSLNTNSCKESQNA